MPGLLPTPPPRTYTMSKARRDSMTVTTRMMMLTGFRAGKTTRRKVWRPLAPSSAAASLSAGSKPFRPAR